jgi:DNA-binding Xre family transcriptional regulator
MQILLHFAHRFVRVDTMTSTTSTKPRRLKWRTRVVMAERGVRSVSALRRQLEDLGIKISDAQLGRIVDGKSSHFNSAVLGGLLAVLNCGLSDLIAVR